jgi:hypothetical protein
VAAPERVVGEDRLQHAPGLGNEVAIETLELAHEGFETE